MSVILPVKRNRAGQTQRLRTELETSSSALSKTFKFIPRMYSNNNHQPCIEQWSKVVIFKTEISY